MIPAFLRTKLVLKLFRRRRLDANLEAELAFHREMAAAAGNVIPLGNAQRIKEQAFDLWRFNATENLWRDLLFAGRTLRKSPVLVFAALLSLGLGIGVNTAIFSLAIEFLLSEPSVRDPASVVYVRQGGNSHAAPYVFEQIQRSGVFQDVAGEKEESYLNYDDGVETHRIFAVQTTKNFFAALGVPVAKGRGWTETDSDQVVVLHPHFWRTRLRADPAILGKTIRLDGRAYTVLGVLPNDYRSLVGYGFAPDVLIPRYDPTTILAIYARLKPGMTLGQLNAALPALQRQLDRKFMSENPADWKLNVTEIGGLARLQEGKEALTLAVFFLMLLAAVGLVLIVACVNVAGLLMARGEARQREIATRMALGASRLRLLQQLLSESLLLSLAGAALGFVFALCVAKAAASIPLPIPVPIRLHIEPDWRVASYAAVLAIVAALTSGFAPALQSLKEPLSARMQRERRFRFRRGLIVAQIAVSFVVLTAAVLFLQNLARAQSLGPGFDIRRTIRADVYLPPNKYRTAGDVNLYVRRGLEALRSVPGVEVEAAARIIPFTDATTFAAYLAFSDTGERRAAKFNWNAVTPDYFRAMDIAIVKGRDFTLHDNGQAKVVVVNEEFVKQYLGKREPLGTVFTWSEEKMLYRIVGVVRATKNMTIGEEPRGQLYEAMAQVDRFNAHLQFVIRSAVPPAAQLARVRRVLTTVEPAAGLEIETMFSAVGFAFLPSKVGAALMGSIGALGLLLAAIGLYGVLAYSVARRRREIGIRIAVGASDKRVAKIVFTEFGRLLLMGIGIGCIVAFFATRPLSMFFVPGLSPSDPASFAVVIVCLALTGVLAVLGPLRRALRVDPVECLRSE